MPNRVPTLTERISERLIEWRWPALVIALGVTVAGFWPSTQLLFDAAITNLFPPDDPVLVAYQQSLDIFGGAEVVVVAYTDPDLLTPEGLDRVQQLASGFRELKELGVIDVASLADARWPEAPLDGRTLVEQVQSRNLTREQLKDSLCNTELYRNLVIGDDGVTTAIAMTLRPKRDDLERKNLIAGIRRRAAESRFPAVVAGGPILTHDAAVLVDEDSTRLGWVSTLALLLVLGILFRRLRWVILPLAVVHVTLVWTKAFLWLCSTQLSMVSTTLTALVTVIGVASVVQVAARYREERERAQARDALWRTMSSAGPAVFWASLTTAAGFASLLVTSIVPIRNFAIMLSLASLLVFFVTATLVPGVVLWGRKPSDPGAAPGERQVERALETMMDWSLRRPWQVSLVATALLVFTLAGIFRIRTETDFTRNFRRSSDVATAYDFVEQRLGGAGTLNLEFSAAQGLNSELLEQLRTLETQLRQNTHLTKVLGLVDVLDFFDAGATGSMTRLLDRVSSVFGTPSGLEAKLAVLNKQRPDLVPTFWHEDQKVMRIMLRAREQAPSETKDSLIAFVAQTAQNNMPESSGPDVVRVTGVYTLLNHLVSGLMSDQLHTFLLASVSVFTIMCLALRSIRLAIVGLVPKLGPVLMVLGAMGWLGVPIDMGTPMIASVSVGISVGFSIHYLYRYRQERIAGLSFDDALRSTHRRVGGAMVFSNLALVIGFAVLSLSNFVPTVHFSLLADVALIGGLAGNLLVLPLLLKLSAV